MSDFNLEQFIDEIQSLAYIRNLDPFNPVVIHVQNPSSNTEFRIIAAIVEPSKYLVPVHGIWIMLDPKSSFYRKCYRLVDPNVAKDPFNATWVEVFSKDAIFNEGQYFDVLRGEPGPKGDPGADSQVPGPAGPQGPAGNAAGIVVATGVVLTSNSLIFKVAKDGTSTPSNILFSAKLENLVGDPVFSVVSGNATLDTVGSITSLRYSNMNTDVVTVRASYTDAHGVEYHDDETVAKVREGSDSVTMLLTNEMLAVPADVDGIVTSYVGASTDVIIYFGVDEVTANWTLSKTDSPGVTSTLSGRTVTVTNLQADAAYVDIKASRIGASPITRRFSVTRVKTGADGAGSHELILNVDSQIFTVDASGQSAPAQVTFNALLKNIVGVPTFSIVDGTAVLTPNGNKAVLQFSSMQTESVKVRASLQYKGVTYQDDTSIVKLHAGASAITALLTNETVTLPANSDGTVISLVGAETLMKIYVGAVEQTDSWTYTKVDSSGLTTILAGNKIAIATLTTDSAYCDITATRTGFPVVVKRFSVSKSKSGIDGSGATAFNVVLSSNSQMFAVLKDGTVSPDTVNFTALLQNVTGTPVWSVSAGQAVIHPAGSVCTLNYSEMDSETATIRVQVQDISSGIVYTDEETVAKIREGTDGVTALLTNESVSLSSDQDGLVDSYVGATTDIVVYLGTADDTAAWTFTKTDSLGLATSITDNKISVQSITVDQGYTDIVASKNGFDPITKRFSVTRTKAGQDGSIKQLIISASSQVFVTDKGGNTSPAQTVFTATLHSLTGTPTFSVISGNAVLTSVDNKATLQFTDMTSTSATVRAMLVEDGITYQDDETVVKLVDGYDTIQALLTNETVTLPADALGTVISYQGASTKIQVFNGIIDTTNLWTFSRVNSEGVSSTLAGNTVTLTSLTSDIGYVDITAARTGFPSITKRFSLSKAKNGSDGSSEGLSISGDSQIFVVDSVGGSSQTKITLTANLNNILGVPAWLVTAGTGNVVASADGLTATVPYAALTTETLTVAASVTYEGLIYSDIYTIAKLHNGSDAITAILSNENVGLAAKSDGTVTSFAGAKTKMVVYSGATDVSAQWTFSKVDSAGITSILSGSLVSVTAMSQDAGYVDITATKDATTLTKRMSLNKVKAGADGNAQLIILNSTSQIYAVDKAGAAAPSEIVFTAVMQNLTGTPTFSVISGQGVLSSVSGVNATLKYVDMLSETVTIRATFVSGGITYQDDETVAKVRSGIDSLTALLTNETASIPATVDGVITSLAGIATDMVIYNGSADVTANYTISKNDGPGITSTIAGKTVTVTTMANDTGYIDITGRLIGGTPNSASVTKRFSLTKVKTGQPGVNGLSVVLSNETFVLNADFTGAVSNYTGAVSALKVLNGTVDDTANWKVTKTDSAGITSTLTGTSVTLTSIAPTTETGSIVLTATRTGYPTLSRTFSISKSKAGQAGTPGTAGTAGANGKRGSMTFYVSGRSSWNDLVATTAASVQGGPQLNDLVVQYNTPTGFTRSRFWNGTSWQTVDQVIDGNLLVRGSVGTDQLAANSIVAGSAIIGAGAVDTLSIEGNAVTQAVAAIQVTVVLGSQVPIPATGVWTEFLRYSNLDVTGSQPLLVWGSCNTVAIHAAAPGEVAKPGQGEETYSGIRWLYNFRATWYGIRVSVVNVVTQAAYHFVCQDGVLASSSETNPATINALFPPIPAGRYDVIVSGRIGAIVLGGNLLEGIGIRSGQVAILETKR